MEQVNNSSKHSALMTISEASEKTGISRQTLTNWMDSKIIPGVRTKNSIWLSTEAIDEICHANLSALKDKLAEEQDQLQKNIQTLKEKNEEIDKALHASVDFLYSISNENVRDNISMAILRVFSEELYDNDFCMVKMFLKGTPSEEIAIQHSMTESMVQKRIALALRRIKKNANTYNEIYNLRAENIRLEEEYRIIKDAYKSVTETNNKLKCELVNYLTPSTESKTNTSVVSDEEYEIVKNLTMSVDSYPFGKRIRNIFKDNNIKTFGDILSYPKYDLLKLRNLGKKALLEIEDVLNSYGLEFGMDIQKYKIKIANAKSIEE